jgi:hypothetical protein
MQQAAPGGLVGPDGRWVSPPQPNPAATPQIATDALVALGQPIADAMNYTASLARGQQPFNFSDALETYGAAALSAMPVTRGEGIAAELAPRIQRLLPRAAESAPEDLLASGSARLYNTPSIKQRPFSEDYPGIARDDGTGRLTHDIEGRPLVAQYVAGRNVVGAPDEAISPARIDALATTATGNAPEGVAARQIGGDAGRLTWLRGRPDALRDCRILIDRGLSDQQKERVLPHEVGHLIDEMAGGIPTAGLNTELRQLYNTLNTGQVRTRNLTLPQHLGYKGDDIDKELKAEAIRAYLVDPNYLKSVAPRTAAAIRAAVNAHPVLSRIIQFNSVPLAAGAAGLGARAVDSVGSSGGDDGTGRM